MSHISAEDHAIFGAPEEAYTPTAWHSAASMPSSSSMAITMFVPQSHPTDEFWARKVPIQADPPLVRKQNGELDITYGKWFDARVDANQPAEIFFEGWHQEWLDGEPFQGRVFFRGSEAFDRGQGRSEPNGRQWHARQHRLCQRVYGHDDTIWHHMAGSYMWITTLKLQDFRYLGAGNHWKHKEIVFIQAGEDELECLQTKYPVRIQCPAPLD